MKWFYVIVTSAACAICFNLFDKDIFAESKNPDDNGLESRVPPPRVSLPSLRPIERLMTQPVPPHPPTVESQTPFPKISDRLLQQLAPKIFPTERSETTDIQEGTTISPRTREEFEQNFGLNNRYENFFQQFLSEKLYWTNEMIFRFYGGFLDWKEQFEATVNNVLVGAFLVFPSTGGEESFWGTPRFRTDLNRKGLGFRIEVPFGK